MMSKQPGSDTRLKQILISMIDPSPESNYLPHIKIFTCANYRVELAIEDIVKKSSK